MDKPWYRKIFPQSQAPVPEKLQAGADRGEAEAQFGMGLKYASATGSAQDYNRAAEWYQKAAEQDHVLAQFNLGVMYARGQGVPQNDFLSVTWIGKAARHGDAGAQFILGMKNVRETVGRAQTESTESAIEGYKWLSLSAAQGYRGSQDACHALALGMSREAVKEGLQRVDSFLAHQIARPAAQIEASAA